MDETTPQRTVVHAVNPRTARRRRVPATLRVQITRGDLQLRVARDEGVIALAAIAHTLLPHSSSSSTGWTRTSATPHPHHEEGAAYQAEGAAD